MVWFKVYFLLKYVRMENLAITCRVLYNQELLEIKRELRKYKKRFDIPKIIVDVGWFQRSWFSQMMLDKRDDDLELIPNMLHNVAQALRYVYEDEYKKHELFFEEQLKQLNETLNIVYASHKSFFNEEDEKDIIYDFTWHFMNNFFEKLNWMYCSGCEDLVRTTRGLCDNCDQLRSPEPSSEYYLDNQDMLADAIDH